VSAFCVAPPPPSYRDATLARRRLGFAVEEEARVLDGLLAVDALMRLPGGARVAVEFDCPSHFLRSIEPAAAPRSFHRWRDYPL